MKADDCLTFLNGKIKCEDYELLKLWLTDREYNIFGLKRKTFQIEMRTFTYQISKRKGSWK